MNILLSSQPTLLPQTAMPHQPSSCPISPAPRQRSSRLLAALVAFASLATGQTTLAQGTRFASDASGNLILAAPGVAGAPSITGQPADAIAAPGTTAGFSVVAQGTPPLGYQWRANGTNIPGATSDSLVLTNVNSAIVGQYSVVVSSGALSTTSLAATLWLDTDRDGLPDAWEGQFFGSVTNQVAGGDRDRDGVSNLDEFREGTNPTNAASLSPRLRITTSGPGHVSAAPLATAYPLNSSVELSAVADNGATFLGWSGDLTGAANPASLVMSTNRRLTALFGIPLATALDTTNLVWTSGGDAGWLGQSTTTQDGVDAAQSGPLEQGDESWIETSVTTPRPVALDFQWRISGTAGVGGTDTLQFSVNGVVQPGAILGTTAWATQAHILPPGTHTLRWKFTKFSTSTRYTDVHNGGFLDRVALRPIAALAPDAIAAVEGASGTREVLVRVSMPEAVLGAASVSYYTTNGTALAGIDYVARTGTLSFPAGQTQATVAIQILGDRLQEGDETFGLVLHRPNGAYITADTAIVTLLDDEIAPADLTLTAEDCLPGNGFIDPGERVTVAFALRNPGPLPTTNLTARLLPGPGVLDPSGPQNYGVLGTNGTPVSRNFSFSGNGPCGATVTAVLVLEDGGVEIGQAAFTFNLGEVIQGTRTFAFAAPIAIPATGNATPYSTTNTVTGIVGTVRKVTLTLIGLQHTNPDDLDLLLVGPGGQSALVLSDAGGTADVASLTVSFAPDAATSVPDTGPLVGGIFRPTNIDTNTDAFAAPAPAGPYTSDLSVFNATNPNGEWRLFVRDDAGSNAGQIAGGWSLAIETFDAFCCQGPGETDLALSAQAVVPVVVGNPSVLSLSVTNRGPVLATDVRVTNSLPPGLEFVSASSSQGSTATSGSNVVTSLGNLALGANATVQLTLRPTLVSSNLTVVSTARTGAEDPDLSNNSTTSALIGALPTLSIGDVTVADATTNALFAVWLSSPTSLEVSTRFAASNATAIAGLDYTHTNGLLVFSPGMVTQFVSVPILADALSEANETFTVRLASATNATFAKPIGTATITDDDAVPAFSVEPLSIPEGQRGTSNATFIVRLSAPSGQSTTVRYATANGTAVAPGDYTARSGTLTFNAGVTTQLLTVAIVGDTVLEPDETFSILLSNPVRATIATPDAVATILNDELMPEGFELTSESCDPTNGVVDPGELVGLSFRFHNPGPLDITNLTVTLGTNVNLLQPSAPVVLDLVPAGTSANVELSFLANGWCGSNAVANLAFTEGTNNRGTLAYEFEMGVIARTTNEFVAPIALTIPAVGSAAPYPATLRVSGVTGTVARVAVTLSNLFHTNPDHLDFLLVGPRGQSVLLLSDSGGSLDVTNLTLRIDDRAATTTPDAAQLVSGTFRPSNFDTTDSFPAPAPAAPFGTSLAVFQKLDPNGDWNLFVVDDSNNEGGSLANGWALTIETFDAECCVDVGASDLALSAATPPRPVIVGHDLVFTLTVTNPQPVTATGVLVTNRPPANTTFVSARGSQGDCFLVDGLIICALGDIPGFSSADVTITVAPNAPGSYTNSATVVAVQPDPNTFNNSAAAIGSAAVPALSIADVLVTEADNASAVATFDLTLTGFSSQPIWVRYATANGTALGGSDFIATNGLVLFNPGTTTQQVRIPLVGDLINEGVETFVLNLSNPTNVTLALTRATAIILDNDPQPEILISDASFPERDSGNSNATFRIVLSAPSSRAVSVNFTTVNGTALSGSDYTARSGTVTWPAGTTDQAITVPILGDTVPEPNESFIIVLSRPIDGVLNQVTALGIILNDDLQDLILIRSVSIDADADACVITFQSVPGRNYRLERSDTFGSSALWTPVESATSLPGTGELITVTDPGATTLPERYYRLVLVP